VSGETYALLLLSAARWLTDVGIVWLVGICAYRIVTARVSAPDTPGHGRLLEVGLCRQAPAAVTLLILATAARLYAQTYSSVGLAPATGHAFAYSGGVVLPMSLQIMHLLSAGIWLGTLLVLLSAGVRAVWSRSTDDGVAVASLVDRFSPVALIAATVLGGTGVVSAILYVDEVRQLWETTYGRALLAKTGLFGVTAALGAYNWRRVRPRIGAPGGVARLRRSGTAELLVAAAVLAVTAWLVHLPMPHE
jgi:putative copper export protein